MHKTLVAILVCISFLSTNLHQAFGMSFSESAQKSPDAPARMPLMFLGVGAAAGFASEMIFEYRACKSVTCRIGFGLALFLISAAGTTVLAKESKVSLDEQREKLSEVTAQLSPRESQLLERVVSDLENGYSLDQIKAKFADSERRTFAEIEEFAHRFDLF